MAISIQEALQLPIMNQTKLVAGFNGLHNMIKWVTIVEVIDDISRLQEGEFLITTGFGLLESGVKREQFHTLLSNKKLSGVAIYTGFYLNEIPASFIEIANQSDLPIIEIPTNINFSMITREILEQIVNKQMRMFEYSLRIHQELTMLVLGKQGMELITTTLSRLINGSILLLDDIGEQIDQHFIHQDIAYDEYNQTICLSEAQIPLSTLQKKPLLAGKGLSVVSYPIIANEYSYGSIIVFKEVDSWGELDSIAVQHAATVYAIEFLKRKAVDDTEFRLKGDFLDEILDKNFKNTSLAIERGKKLGYDLTQSQSVYFLRLYQDAAIHSADQLYAFVQQRMRKWKKQFIIRNKLNGLFLLTTADESENDRNRSIELAQTIVNDWKTEFSDVPIAIGIGRHYHDIQKISQSAQEAQYAVNFSKLLIKSKDVIHYDDLGLYHILIQMKEAGLDLKEFYEAHLHPLISNKRQSADLLHTLESYLHNNQSIQATSAELYIHRHTLKYRLNQIEIKTGMSLESADDRTKLLLSIMAFKLLHFEN